MYKIVLFCLAVTSVYPNMFMITDKKGHIIHNKTMTHHTNAFFAQKATEYSIQALYNELHKEENRAKNALNAKQKAQTIVKAQQKAQKAGKTYHLSKRQKQQLIEEAKFYKGGKYIWGGTTPKGFDCSGYVQYLYKKYQVNLPRTAYAQSKKGQTIFKPFLQKGDLLFFLTDKKRKIPVTHVGIYLGNGKFIHAASKKKGIIISPLETGYYAKKFVSAKRILKKG